MRTLVGIGLVLAAVHGGALRADPTVPQLDPAHGHREDAQRLTEQLRELDRERPPALPPGPVAPSATDASTRSRTAVAGWTLLAVALTTGVLTLTLYDTTDGSALDNTKPFLAVTSALTGVTGLGLVIASRPVQVAPTVTPNAVGLAIAGRL